METKKLAVALMVAALALVALSGCPKQQTAEQMPPGEPVPGPEPTTKIVQIGSTTVLPIAEKWREAFNQTHPNVEIAVSGGGSGTGIEALIAGTCDIANSSRPMKDKEKEAAAAAGITPVEHVVAYDGIAVIVHPDNPLTNIDFQKLSDIYVGDITSWDAVGAKGLGDIQVVSRDSSSGTYEAFKEIVVTLHGKQKDRDYTSAALKEASNEAILKLVAQTKTAIGYVGLGYLDNTVKALAIVPLGGGQPVAPTVENVKSGTYPIARELYMYTKGEPTGVLAEYFNWALGSEGQAIVAELGFVPLK